MLDKGMMDVTTEILNVFCCFDSVQLGKRICGVETAAPARNL
jgi:hypothetical protein